jgi:hypothetical protein
LIAEFGPLAALAMRAQPFIFPMERSSEADIDGEAFVALSFGCDFT